MKNKSTLNHKLATLVSLVFALYVSPGFTAELTKLAWEAGTEEAILHIRLDGSAQYTTETLDQGKRLRVSLSDTSLGVGAVDISGRALVKGVFPYLSDDGKSVHIDVLLREPGKLEISSTDKGYRIVALSAATTSESAQAPAEVETPAVSQAPAVPEVAIAQDTASDPKADFNTLEDIRFSPLPGGRVQIDLRMSRAPDEPGTFSTAKPARIALDFFETKSGLSKPTIEIGTGAVASITTISTDDRTRVVLNLIRPVSYDTQLHSNGMTVVVESPQIERGGVVVKAKTSHFAKAPEVSRHSISRIDFRRTRDGGGKVIVDLSDSKVGIDIREDTGEIIIDFLNTGIPAELERRLDVVDFATPVQNIDTFAQGKHTRMVVSPTGKYEHLTYQTGNVFTVQVKPVIEDEEEKKVDEYGYSGEKLSLNFQKISVRAALQVIADFTGLNFVTSDSVSGTLTLRLQDVPWDQALDIILQSKGLAKREKGNVVWVAPAREIESRERAALEATKQVAELEPLVSELIQINYAKAKDLAKLLKSIKSVDTGITQGIFGGVSVGQLETESNSLLSPRGNVTVDIRTNTLLIQDVASKIREVKKLIAKLDKPVRQVLVETRIVEANDDFSKSLGARFGFQRFTQQAKFPGSGKSNIGDAVSSGSLEGVETITDSLLDDDGVIEFDTGSTGLNVDLPSAGAGGDPAAQYALSIFKAGTGFAHLLSLEISALEAEGKGKVISNPRLITANQKQARIEQGQERIFTTSVLGVGSVITKKAVLSLTVTPQITPDDRIILDVFITKDSFVGATSPTINTKQITTQVLLENGETVVIGGIFQRETTQFISKVPILGDLPLLGRLFKKKSTTDNRTELLIFLTPRILDPALNIS